jgi:hypothetical protein
MVTADLLLTIEYRSLTTDCREGGKKDQEIAMLPTPHNGQYVRLDDYGGRLIVKAVSEDGGRVDLVSECNPKYVRNDVRCRSTFGIRLFGGIVTDMLFQG